MMPAPCAASSASATCTPRLTTVETCNGPDAIASYKVLPRSSSITR
jgi:hypothetical protein